MLKNGTNEATWMKIEIYRGRQIEVGHLVERELPEELVLVRVQRGVVGRVDVATAVGQPNVEAELGQVEAQVAVVLVVDATADAVHQKVGAGAHQSMLQ